MALEPRCEPRSPRPALGALHGRLEHVASAVKRPAPADLVVLHVEHLGGLEQRKESFRERARAIERMFEQSPGSGSDSGFAALGRIYDHLGETAAEERILELRLSSSLGSSAPPVDPDLYFRLARSKLSNEATVAEGLALLEKALDLRLDAAHANRALAN